jgi:hypothetical protein
MSTDQEIKPVVEKILSSRDFKDSPVYKNLLTYLVEATMARRIPKEVTIAIEVFGKDPSYNSNKDSTVRYHVHILRNKLESYYRQEGKDDKLRLSIPKGHYQIEYVSPNLNYRKFWGLIPAWFKSWEAAAIILLSLAALLMGHRLFFLQRSFPAPAGNQVEQDDQIWGTFFKNGYPVSIVLGDDFLLDEYRPEIKRYRQIRDWRIDNQDDLREFLLRHPDNNLWKSEITGIPFGGVDNLMDLLPVIYQFQNNISLHLSSMMTLDEIQKRNIIYIGEFKNLRVLDKIIYKTPVRYQYRPDERLFIMGGRNDTLRTFVRIEAPYEQKDKYNIDYSLIIKVPGFYGENIMFVVGFGYGGRLERTRMLGNRQLRAELIKTINKNFSHVPEYFIAVFEVKSIERTGFTNELKYFQEVSRDLFK